MQEACISNHPVHAGISVSTEHDTIQVMKQNKSQDKFPFTFYYPRCLLSKTLGRSRD